MKIGLKHNYMCLVSNDTFIKTGIQFLFFVYNLPLSKDNRTRKKCGYFNSLKIDKYLLFRLRSRYHEQSDKLH
jgi:hypothetical protein